MSTAQQYLYFDNTSAANFRQWGEGISAQLTTAGWTKTADTGQVDWTSDPAVPAAGNYVYEIREPASDALQTGATAYYIKIEYGTKATNCPQIRLTLGTGTDGAGGLTGYTTTAQVIGGSAGTTALGAVGYECSFSWDTSRLGVLLWRNAGTSNCSVFAIERTKNTDGSDSADGVTLMLCSGGSSAVTTVVFQRTLIFGIGPAVAMNQWGVLSASPSAGTGVTDTFNNSIGVSPTFPNYGGWGNPQTVLAVVQYDAGVEGAYYQTTLYGATRTYLCSKTICNGKERAPSTAGLLRYD